MLDERAVHGFVFFPYIHVIVDTFCIGKSGTLEALSVVGCCLQDTASLIGLLEYLSAHFYSLLHLYSAGKDGAAFHRVWTVMGRVAGYVASILFNRVTTPPPPEISFDIIGDHGRSSQPALRRAPRYS